MLSIEKEADETVNEIALKMKPEIEAKLDMKFTLYKVINYRTQTVRGKNFFIKLKLAGVSASSLDADAANASEADVQKELKKMNNQPIKFVHVRIWRDLPVNDFKLTLYPLIQTDKCESDPIDYFE